MNCTTRLDRNNEARMTKDERMTKSEGPDARAEDSFWDDGAALVREQPETKRIYDLEERTARFREAIIDFAKAIPQDPITNRIITQRIAAATSVGANYVEADDAVSKKEFLKNIGTCRKEARETKHFLRMIVGALPELKPQTRTLWLEAKELHLIFSKFGEISRSLTAMRTSKAGEITCRLRHSSLFIPSLFDIRISSFSRI